MLQFLPRKFIARNRPTVALFGTLAAAGFALATFTGQADATSLQARLQELADHAALAGVNSLGTSEAQTDVDRREEAIKATKQSIGDVSSVERQITASISDLTVTVKLSMVDSAKAIEAASTARYIAPDQTSNWSWASRQHFAAGRPPVVAGLNHRPAGF